MGSRKFLPTIVLAALLPILAQAQSAERPAQEQSPSAKALTNSLAFAEANVSTLSPRSAQTRASIRKFYADHGNVPVWSGTHRDIAQKMLEELNAAERYGLNPGDYAVPTPWPGKAGQDSALEARFDVELTAATLQFLSDLHFGRTAPDFQWYGGRHEPDNFDPVQSLAMAIARADLPSMIAAAEPSSTLYARVKQTLAHYRDLEPKSRQLAPLPPLPLQRDGAAPYPGAQALQQHLVLLGDIAESAATESGGVNDMALEAGLKQFQMRHGLEQDGILGKATMSALAVPLSQRIRQLEFTLERLRWLPRLPPGPMIVVNVPSFRLWALDTSVVPSSVELDMRVIVGNAARTPTPLLIAQLRYLEFNPAWNIPRSIEVKEFIPKLERDPDLLRKQDIELVPRNALVDTESASPLEALRAGTVRLRQRPGPRNALGAVKFSMPNPLSIYLHSTPATELFAKPRRDLSHGCIRLEHADALAVFALRNEEGWDRAAVLAAMEPGPTRTVTLSAPIPVILLYATALSDRQGHAIFLQDAYGLDKKLADAMAAERQAAQPALSKASD